jgi:hypothetical protein
VAEIMRLAWQTVNKIMKATVERRLLRRGDAVIEYAGVRLGHRHRLTMGGSLGEAGKILRELPLRGEVVRVA